MKRICVFCGAKAGNRPEYFDAARRLGRTLAEHGIGTVFGGGRVGLMGAVADAALESGGEVIGVIPETLVDVETPHPNLTHLDVVSGMHERKALMAEYADGFIALPGGFGTLDELAEILTWAQLRIHAKPIGLLNVSGYFRGLLIQLDRAVEDGLLRGPHRSLVLEASEPASLLSQMAERAAPTPPAASSHRT